MDRREAKREACALAAALVDDFLVAADLERDGPERRRLAEGLAELRDELDHRAGILWAAASFSGLGLLPPARRSARWRRR